ncbi:lycopene cyclase domain-containing protein [Halorussus sp. MSC15.2]|nr:lycopene cyclase domain-containing protein [Halorussus sp. MSC15.2]
MKLSRVIEVRESGGTTAESASDRSFLPTPTVLGRVIPDIGAAFGQYTYLLTEVVWGTVAVGLLYRAGALVQAARTIGALYPIAYVWDWYTLRIGVFEIPLRTGVELLGIPIEEHLFMVVVPALVLGIHETLRKTDERHPSSGTVENRG